MKKFLCLILIFAMGLCFAGCGNSPESISSNIDYNLNKLTTVLNKTTEANNDDLIIPELYSTDTLSKKENSDSTASTPNKVSDIATTPNINTNKKVNTLPKSNPIPAPVLDRQIVTNESKPLDTENQSKENSSKTQNNVDNNDNINSLKKDGNALNKSTNTNVNNDSINTQNNISTENNNKKNTPDPNKSTNIKSNTSSNQMDKAKDMVNTVTESEKDKKIRTNASKPATLSINSDKTFTLNERLTAKNNSKNQRITSSYYTPRRVSNVDYSNSNFNTYLGKIEDIYLMINDAVCANDTICSCRNDIFDCCDILSVLSKQVKSGEIDLSEEQSQSCNELLSQLGKCINKITDSRNNVANSCKALSENGKVLTVGVDRISSQYVTVINSLDERITNYQNVLTILQQLQCILTDTCYEQNNFSSLQDGNILNDILNNGTNENNMNNGSTNNKNDSANSNCQYYDTFGNCYTFDKSKNCYCDQNGNCYNCTENGSFYCQDGTCITPPANQGFTILNPTENQSTSKDQTDIASNNKNNTNVKENTATISNNDEKKTNIDTFNEQTIKPNVIKKQNNNTTQTNNQKEQINIGSQNNNSMNGNATSNNDSANINNTANNNMTNSNANNTNSINGGINTYNPNGVGGGIVGGAGVGGYGITNGVGTGIPIGTNGYGIHNYENGITNPYRNTDTYKLPSAIDGLSNNGIGAGMGGYGAGIANGVMATRPLPSESRRNFKSFMEIA